MAQATFVPTIKRIEHPYYSWVYQFGVWFDEAVRLTYDDLEDEIEALEKAGFVAYYDDVLDEYRVHPRERIYGKDA